MKPIIIAGNGPSLKSIDYSRIPKDFDLFRCNQFYFEEEYFLGKKIKGVFFNPQVLKEQFFTLQHLRDRQEYEVEDVYCNVFGGINEEGEKYIDYYFPSIKKASRYISLIPTLHNLLKFYQCYYEKNFTSGIIMTIVAIAQGYKEIYLTGIDFYEGGGTDYAFDIQNKANLKSILPQFSEKNFKDSMHSKEVDIHALQTIKQLEDITLYSLTPETTLSRLIPLAPKTNSNPINPIPKPKGFICDTIPLPQLQIKKEKSLKTTIKNLGITADNIYVKIFLDLRKIITALMKLIFKKQ